MDTDQLSLLLDVVREGSFAGAARARQVTPSTVSRGISGLEAELGVRLFHRTTRHLSLTEAGQRYVDRVTPIVAGLADAARHAHDATQAQRGTVRATMPVSFAVRCIAPLLPALRHAHPGITLDCLITDRRVSLLDERVDFAVRLGRLTDPDLVARRLFATRYRVVAAPDWVARHGAPAAPANLSEADALVFPLPSETRTWRLRRDGEEVEIALRPALQASNMLVLRQAALAGLGVAVLPHWLADGALAEGRLVQLLGDWEATLSTFGSSAWLVLPTRRYVPARVRTVMDFLADALAPWAAPAHIAAN